MEERCRHLKGRLLAVLFLSFHACHFSYIWFCAWEPNTEANAPAFVAEICVVTLDSEDRGLLVTKYLGFTLLGVIFQHFCLVWRKDGYGAPDYVRIF